MSSEPTTHLLASLIVFGIIPYIVVLFAYVCTMINYLVLNLHAWLLRNLLLPA